MFASEIKKQRERCGFSQKEVEELLCLRKGTVKNWESGKSEPDLETLKLLAAFYFCTTDSLLGFANK